MSEEVASAKVTIEGGEPISFYYATGPTSLGPPAGAEITVVSNDGHQQVFICDVPALQPDGTFTQRLFPVDGPSSVETYEVIE